MIEKKTVAVIAGGTGGHIYPALAFAAQWQLLGHDVFWIGTEQGLESSIVPQESIPLYFVSGKGLRRSGKLNQLKALFQGLKGFFQAFLILKRLKPHVVLGMGGYVSGPGLLAARCLGIPIVIHEQNAIPGKTNQYMARFAKRVLTAFPEVLSSFHPIVCGNPVRKTLMNLKPKQAANKPLRLLVLGGSRGALNLNQALPSLLTSLEEVEIWHQTGEAHFSLTQSIYADIQKQGANSSIVKVSPYIQDMQEAYDWADIVICRAGAMTVFEIMAVGRPAIFIPYPYAVDDHQTKNALYLVNKCAAFLVAETNLTLLKERIDALKEMINYQRYARNVYANRVIDADQSLVHACLEVAT